MDEATRDAIIAAEITQSERTVDEPFPEDVEPIQPNLARSRVYTVRLSEVVVAELERVAEARGVPASAMARGFIEAGLAAERDSSVADGLARVEAELARVRQMLGPVALDPEVRRYDLTLPISLEASDTPQLSVDAARSPQLTVFFHGEDEPLVLSSGWYSSDRGDDATPVGPVPRYDGGGN